MREWGHGTGKRVEVRVHQSLSNSPVRRHLAEGLVNPPPPLGVFRIHSIPLFAFFAHCLLFLSFCKSFPGARPFCQNQEPAVSARNQTPSDAFCGHLLALFGLLLASAVFLWPSLACLCLSFGFFGLSLRLQVGFWPCLGGVQSPQMTKKH